MTAISATSPPRLSIDDSAAASHSRADLPAPRAALYIGCAGWSVPAAHAARFPDGGSHLERYAQVFNSVEINSSFYRPHKPATYRKWAAMVPVGFRFAVKMPRSISHQARLQACLPELGAFLDQAGNLGDRLGCLLLQLPPSLAYDAAMLLPFFDQLRQLHGGPVVCEPQHVSWFNPSVSRALCEHHIARVAADPAPIPRAALPAGDRSMQYLRLHGSPRMYYDAYTETALHRIARQLSRPSRCTSQRWCIFDNTGLGHATVNALALLDLT
jgi:uncharacterized protein YecE (DUF72 family)